MQTVVPPECPHLPLRARPAFQILGTSAGLRRAPDRRSPWSPRSPRPLPNWWPAPPAVARRPGGSFLPAVSPAISRRARCSGRRRRRLVCSRTAASPA